MGLTLAASLTSEPRLTDVGCVADPESTPELVRDPDPNPEALVDKDPSDVLDVKLLRSRRGYVFASFQSLPQLRRATHPALSGDGLYFLLLLGGLCVHKRCHRSSIFSSSRRQVSTIEHHELVSPIGIIDPQSIHPLLVCVWCLSVVFSVSSWLRSSVAHRSI